MSLLLDQIRLLFSRLRRLNYRHVLPDSLIILLSLYGSLYLRLGWEEVHSFLPIMNRYVALFLVIRLGTFLLLGIYDIIWRYVSTHDALKLFKAVLLSSLLIIAATYLVDIARLPRAVFFIDAFLVALFLGGIRFSRRLLFEASFGKMVRRSGNLTLIYGAGVNGRSLANRFSTDNLLGFNLVGFLDDNPQKLGRTIAGVKVIGTIKELNDIINEYYIKEVVVAISQLKGELLREVVRVCREFNIKPRMVLNPSGLTGRDSPMDSVRSIELHDLLNRPRKDTSIEVLKSIFKNRRIIVTGAGGSIGSELARQVFNLDPALLLLLDHSELNLYQIDQELRLSASESKLVIPLLVDIKDRQSLSHVFQVYRPEIVLHAAAYKHVHLVEHNPSSSILNNIGGTKNLLDLSSENDIETFVMISTDKAVNPAGVMGATKRVCELMVTAMGEKTGKRYCSVRFGNVLGSSGSLIPLLKSQIEKGEPLTITHKDMTRYFMLIPEAVSLVLKAASIARPGDITILKMGEPVKIVDIATSLIALMGKSNKEIPIVFTGLRPGEKIHEELYLSGNEIETSDPDILVLPRGDLAYLSSAVSFKDFMSSIDEILVLAHEGKKDAVIRMKALTSPASKDPNFEAPAFSAFHSGYRREKPSEIWH